MARKRMFCLDITYLNDDFLELESRERDLYMALTGMADDDGFVKNPKTVRRLVDATDKEMRALADRGFILEFDTGAVAIRHWLLHNSIREKGYVPTLLQTEREQIYLDDARAFTLTPTDTPYEGAIYHKLDKYTRKSLKAAEADDDIEETAPETTAEQTEEAPKKAPPKQKKAKKEKEEMNPLVQRIIDRWNQIVESKGYMDKRVQSLKPGSQAYNFLLSRAVYLGEDEMMKVLDRAEKAEMLPLSWFTFRGILCNEEKLEKLISGAYDKTWDTYGDTSVRQAKERYAAQQPKEEPKPITMELSDEDVEYQTA